MATKHHPPKHGPEGYEHSDADVRNLYYFAVSLAILILAVMWAMVHTYNFFAVHESLGPPASPFENRRPLPPQPRLQPNPLTDLKRYCELGQEQLTTYGWVDQQNGLVRVPIDRAMDIVLQKGLPARPANQAPPETVITPVGAASEQHAVGVTGPCGYLTQQAEESGESKKE